MRKAIIYDFGSNNGDDIPYYLKKGDLVVAVEANPTLCKAMKNRFASEISEGRLVIENCVVTTPMDMRSEVHFYIHRREHVRSQFPRPEDAHIAEYTQVILPARSATAIIHQHGDPLYVKVDIEGYDMEILKSIFSAGIRPPYLSAEAHDRGVFDIMANTGGYSAFKLVDGASVSLRYRETPIQTTRGLELFSFPHHSAGPFGDDINGPWLTKERISRVLDVERVGWKDIHATNTTPPDPNAGPPLLVYWLQMFAYFVGRRALPPNVRMAIRAFIHRRHGH